MADNEEQPGRDEDLSSGPLPGFGKARGNGLVVMVGLLVLIGAPLASYWVVRLTGSPLAERTPRVERRDTSAPVVLRIDSMVVNISGTRMTRVLRMQPHLVLSEPRLEEELNGMMPMVKDRIMATAARRTLDELEALEDREALKRDIVNEINAMIRDRMSGTVLDVAFSEFLIQ